MTNFIPIFPLGIIVYPGESLNLHIFEPRYKQLIKECIDGSKMFGIPSVLENKMSEYGTLMEITEMVFEYENGEMDIRTRGAKIFRVLEVVQQIPEKLYSGAIVNYPDNVMERRQIAIGEKILEELKQLYGVMHLEAKFPANEKAISYEIAHFVGLSKEQEYELLSIFDELQRLEYLRRHLNKVIPVARELERVRARVQMNGHFRNLSLDNLDL